MRTLSILIATLVAFALNLLFNHVGKSPKKI